jgi:hypothetical protein
MIPAMKSSPFDTFCRALVLGAVLGALGWGAVRYTNLPQIALKKIVALSHAAQGGPAAEKSPNNSQVTSAITPISPPPVEHLPVAQNRQSKLTNIYSGSPGTLPHPTQQAAYLEPTAPPTPTPPLAQPGDLRKEMEQRLCELGAVYSLLEMWGHENFRYRYHCRVSIANNRQVTRSFEANGTSPEEAMQQVLNEVEGFQSTTSLQGPQVR